VLDCFKLTCLPAGQAMHCCCGNMRQQDEGTYLSYVIAAFICWEVYCLGYRSLFWEVHCPWS